MMEFIREIEDDPFTAMSRRTLSNSALAMDPESPNPDHAHQPSKVERNEANVAEAFNECRPLLSGAAEVREVSVGDGGKVVIDGEDEIGGTILGIRESLKSLCSPLSASFSAWLLSVLCVLSHRMYRQSGYRRASVHRRPHRVPNIQDNRLYRFESFLIPPPRFLRFSPGLFEPWQGGRGLGPQIWRVDGHRRRDRFQVRPCHTHGGGVCRDVEARGMEQREWEG